MATGCLCVCAEPARGSCQAAVPAQLALWLQLPICSMAELGTGLQADWLGSQTWPQSTPAVTHIHSASLSPETLPSSPPPHSASIRVGEPLLLLLPLTLNPNTTTTREVQKITITLAQCATQAVVKEPGRSHHLFRLADLLKAEFRNSRLRLRRLRPPCLGCSRGDLASLSPLSLWLQSCLESPFRSGSLSLSLFLRTRTVTALLRSRPVRCASRVASSGH